MKTINVPSVKTTSPTYSKLDNHIQEFKIIFQNIINSQPENKSIKNPTTNTTRTTKNFNFMLTKRPFSSKTNEPKNSKKSN